MGNYGAIGRGQTWVGVPRGDKRNSVTKWREILPPGTFPVQSNSSNTEPCPRRQMARGREEGKHTPHHHTGGATENVHGSVLQTARERVRERYGRYSEVKEKLRN